MMKRYRFLFLIIIVLTISIETRAQSESFRISGKIAHSPNPFALLYSDAGIDTIPIRNDGSMSFAKELKKAEYATLIIPKTRLYLGLWIQNDRMADVYIDADDLSRTAVKGDTKAENDFFQSENQSIKSRTSRSKDFLQFDKDWRNLSDSIIAKAAKIGNNDFTTYQKKYLANTGDNRRVTYYERLMNQGQAVNIDKDYNEFMESININDETNARNSLIFHYLKWSSLCNGASNNDYGSMLYILDKHISNQRIRDEYGFRLLKMYLTSHKDKSEVSDSVCQIATNVVSDSIKEKIKSFYLNFLRPEGSIIPDFVLLDRNDRRVDFHDICNKKIIFVDVWSTWCVPCCREIPFIAKLVERYKNDADVKFISISIDKNRNNWKSFMKKNNMTWEQYNIPYEDQRAFLNLFAINGIPRFMILGKGGTVINMNAPAPSDKTLITLIDQKKN